MCAYKNLIILDFYYFYYFFLVSCILVAYIHLCLISSCLQSQQPEGVTAILDVEFGNKIAVGEKDDRRECHHQQ